PAEFFAPYSPAAQDLCRQGRAELAGFAGRVDMALGDSSFNCAELLDLGFANPRVLPVWVDLEKFRDTPPNPEVMEKYDDGWVNFLFVGRVYPHKRQDDVIRVFAQYNRFIRRRSRLFLIGTYSGMEPYFDHLRQLSRSLGVAEHV